MILIFTREIHSTPKKVEKTLHGIPRLTVQCWWNNSNVRSNIMPCIQARSSRDALRSLLKGPYGYDSLVRFCLEQNFY